MNDVNGRIQREILSIYIARIEVETLEPFTTFQSLPKQTEQSLLLLFFTDRVEIPFVSK